MGMLCCSTRVTYLFNFQLENRGHFKIKYIDFEVHALSRMELPSPVGEG